MSLPVSIAGSPVNQTQAGNGIISAGPCRLIGFYVNSTSSGTLAFKDGGSSGTAIAGTITPSAGWNAFPCIFGTSAYVTYGGTINVTFFIDTGS